MSYHNMQQTLFDPTPGVLPGSAVGNIPHWTIKGFSMSSLSSGFVSFVAAAILLSVGQAAFAADGNQSAAVSDGAADTVEVLPVRPNIYMLTVGGNNIALEVGEDGAVVVDTGPPGTGAAVLRAIKKITNEPIRYIVDTSADPDRVGNNETLSKAGTQLGGAIGVTGEALGFAATEAAAPITSYQTVLNRMITSPPNGVAYSGTALPREFFDTPQRNIYLNGGAIDFIWQPAAHSDGDSVVVFRRDDVVVTGNVFDMTRFPVIEVDNGGSIQGEIDSINRLLDTQIDPVTPLEWREGQRYGTLVIPARGQLSEQADMVQYRDMLTIIRDRVQAWMKQGKTLQQIVAMQPAAGYAPRFGATTGLWTTDMFVEAVYKSLKNDSVKRAKH